MKRVFCLTIAICALWASRPAMATTDDETFTPYLTGAAIAGTGLLIANTVEWTRNGSNALGVTGVFFGMTQAALGAGMANEESGFGAAFIAIGTLNIITGFGSMIRASHQHDQDPDIKTRLQVDPSFRAFDGQRWLGLQLTSSW